MEFIHAGKATIFATVAVAIFLPLTCIGFEKCPDLLLTAIAIDAESATEVIRSRNSAHPVNLTYQYENETYGISSLIGESTNKIYLAKNRSNETVIIKILKDPKNIYINEYERIATEFYEARGFEVPKIISFDPTTGTIVKQYKEGLSITEIRNHEVQLFEREEILVDGQPWPKPAKELRQLRTLLDTAIAQIQAVHGELSDWVRVHYPELLKTISPFLHHGDLKPQDFIFSIKAKTWILIDP